MQIIICKHISRSIFCAFILCVLAIPKAISNHFFQHFTVSSGLPNNHIQSLFKDRYGFVWIGTSNGLSQYDGYSFRNFLNNPNDSNSLPNNNVRSVAEDKNGIIWLGLWGGVATFNPSTQKFSKKNLYFSQGLDKVIHVLCDSKNRIWVSTNEGLYIYKNNGTLVKHFKAGKGKHDLPNKNIVQTYEDKKGNIWVTGGCGLCLFREATLDFDVHLDDNPPYVEGNEWLNSVGEGIADHQGILWFGSWANGLRRINPVTKHYTTWLTKPEFTAHGAYNVISATAEFDGKIWVASHDQGLGYLDDATNKLFFFKTLSIKGYNMPVKKVTRLLPDGEVLWIGGSNGLYKYDLRKQLFEVFQVPDMRVGSCLPEIQSVAEYNANDLFLATWTCGLFQLNTKSGSINKRSHPHLITLSSPLNIDIKNILKENDSTFWYATSHGLCVESGKRIKYFKPGGETQNMLSENYFYKVKRSADGSIWAGSGRGILKIDPATWEYKKYTLDQLAPAYKGKTNDNIVDITEAPNGDIWFLRRMGGDLFQLGITVLRKHSGQFVTYVAGQGKFKNYPFPQTAFGLQTTSDGQVFVSSERGLISFPASNPQSFTFFTSFHGLLADPCYDLVEDSQKNLWIQNEDGLSCLNLKTKKIKTFTTADGLPDAGLISLTTLKNGKIAIGLDYGWLSILNPKPLSKFNTSSNLFKFTKLEVEGQNLWPTDSLTLPQDANVIRLSFSPFHFLTATDQFFKVTINRENQKSTYQTSSNQIMLSDLRPGWYKVNVTAPGLKTIDIHFYKKPWFWQTTWFLVLCIVLAFATLTALLLYRQRKILAKREEERSIQFQISDMQMTALRSQIDAHFIFNALNAINNFIWQKLPEQASDYLTQFARLMRINLEHTRTDWVYLADELKAVEYYFNLEALAFEPAPVLKMKLPSTDQLTSILIPPMLLQPIVENVFKHAFAGILHQGQLHIDVKLENDLLILNALDNGRGISSHAASGAHKSLASRIMNERLDLINKKLGTKAGFSLERISIEGQDKTLATLKIPYKSAQI